MLGGRAFADLLKCNMTVKHLDLAGNEVPDDIQRNIASALDRNGSRAAMEWRAKQQSETLSATLQTLSSQHQTEMAKLSLLVARGEERVGSFRGELETASSEIQQTQAALVKTQAKLESVHKEKQDFEELVSRERSATRTLIDQVKHDLSAERDKRMKAEDQYRAIFDQLQEKISLLKEAKLDVAVLTKDKSHFIAEVHQVKDRYEGSCD